MMEGFHICCFDSMAAAEEGFSLNYTKIATTKKSFRLDAEPGNKPAEAEPVDVVWDATRH